MDNESVNNKMETIPEENERGLGVERRNEDRVLSIGRKHSNLKGRWKRAGERSRMSARPDENVPGVISGENEGAKEPSVEVSQGSGASSSFRRSGERPHRYSKIEPRRHRFPRDGRSDLHKRDGGGFQKEKMANGGCVCGRIWRGLKRLLGWFVGKGNDSSCECSGHSAVPYTPHRRPYDRRRSRPYASSTRPPRS
jgi:hypothetical protein